MSYWWIPQNHPDNLLALPVPTFAETSSFCHPVLQEHSVTLTRRAQRLQLAPQSVAITDSLRLKEPRKIIWKRVARGEKYSLRSWVCKLQSWILENTTHLGKLWQNTQKKRIFSAFKLRFWLHSDQAKTWDSVSYTHLTLPTSLRV